MDQLKTIICERGSNASYGSPIAKLSPAFSEGTRPSDPTKAAAPSLHDIRIPLALVNDLLVRPRTADLRDDVSVEVRSDSYVKDPKRSYASGVEHAMTPISRTYSGSRNNR
jgi:hypothetical protein